MKDLLSIFHKGATFQAVSSARGFQKSHYFPMQSCYEAFIISNVTEVNSFTAVKQDVETILKKHGINFFHQAWTAQLKSSFVSSQCTKMLTSDFDMVYFT